jgi:hypothetical protein
MLSLFECFELHEPFFSYLEAVTITGDMDANLDVLLTLTAFNSEFVLRATHTPVRIRVRIDPPHPHVCRKRRLIRAVLRMRPEKTMSRVTAGVAR